MAVGKASLSVGERGLPRLALTCFLNVLSHLCISSLRRVGTFLSGDFAYSSLDIPLISKTWVLGWVLMLVVGRRNS